jgi:DNA-directed RNA polymerase specialized sigma24 family protein
MSNVAPISEACPESGIRPVLGLSVAGWQALAARRSDLVRAFRKWSSLDPEDVAQDALAEAWRYRATFDATRTTAWNWLLMIGHRAARRRINVAKRTTLVPLEREVDDHVWDWLPSREPRADDVLISRAGLAEFAKLPAKHRVALETVIDGDYVEAARELGTTPGSLRVTVFRLRRDLRAALEHTTRIKRPGGGRPRAAEVA